MKALFIGPAARIDSAKVCSEKFSYKMLVQKLLLRDTSFVLRTGSKVSTFALFA